MFFVRSERNGHAGPIIGFFAACPVKHSYFRKLISCKSTGVETTGEELGNDPGSHFTYVDIKHWYIRRGKAPPEAMLWLLRQALDRLISPGTLPVLYGHTVTKLGRKNYRSVGFANYGEDPTHNPYFARFALDSRRDEDEQSRAASWVLTNLCSAVSALPSRQPAQPVQGPLPVETAQHPQLEAIEQATPQQAQPPQPTAKPTHTGPSSPLKEPEDAIKSGAIAPSAEAEPIAIQPSESLPTP
jgi:hypothetical protein